MIGLAACDQPTQTPFEPDLGISSHNDREHSLAVYTQNLFHGGDTDPILTLDFNDIPAVIQEANIFWGDVQASDFQQRAVEIVDGIEEKRGCHTSWPSRKSSTSSCVTRLSSRSEASTCWR